jgi:hypothetical protein
MKRKLVDSTSIKSVGYNEQKKILEIEFMQGWTYHYFNVPVAIYVALINANSVGVYFHRNIKTIYRYKRKV